MAMPTFYVIVHKDPDSDFGVTVPDLPGCFSAAETYEGLVPMAREAMKAWMEIEGDREPSSIVKIAAEWEQDLEGGFIMAVPFEGWGATEMKKSDFEGIRAGLEDAIAYMQGDKARGRVARQGGLPRGAEKAPGVKGKNPFSTIS